jgi:phosphate transport system protein
LSERPLDEGITKITGIVSDMADLAVNTVKASVSAYLEGGSVEVQVRAWSDALRSMHNDIEELSIQLMSRHQPVATDLRTIKSSIKIAYDLSRFGRYALDISSVHRLFEGYKRPEVNEASFIRAMGDKVLEMLYLAVEIYKTRNFTEIDKISKFEKEVDEMYINHLRTMAQRTHKKTAILISDILLSRHLERIADHACYIVEETHYMINGRQMYIR